MNRGWWGVWLVIAACAPEERKVPVERPLRWIEYGRTSGRAMPYEGQLLTAVAVREAHVERDPTHEFLMVAIEGLGALHVGDSFDSFVFVGDQRCGLVWERVGQRQWCITEKFENWREESVWGPVRVDRFFGGDHGDLQRWRASAESEWRSATLALTPLIEPPLHAKTSAALVEAIQDPLRTHLRAVAVRDVETREPYPLDAETDVTEWSVIEFTGLQRPKLPFSVFVAKQQCWLAWQGERAFCVVPRTSDLETQSIWGPSSLTERFPSVSRAERDASIEHAYRFAEERDDEAPLLNLPTLEPRTATSLEALLSELERQ